MTPRVDSERSRGPRARALGCESLEGRQLLTISPALVAKQFNPSAWFGAHHDHLGGPLGGRHDHLPGNTGQPVQPGQLPGGTSNPTLAADFTRLRTDMQAIQAKSTATPAQFQAVHFDFKQIDQALIAGGSTRQAAHTELAGLMSSAGKLASPPDLSTFQTKLTALQSQGVSASLTAQTLADIQTVVNVSQVSAADQQTLKADQQAILKDSGGKIDLSVPPTGHRLHGFGPGQ